MLIEEVFMLLEGLANAPRPILNHLWNNEEATLEELQDLFGFRSKRFVESWLRKMIDNLALERFWYTGTDRHTYALSKFARRMLIHIREFPAF